MKLRILLISSVLLLLPQWMQAAAVSPATLDLVGNRGEVTNAVFTVINTLATEQRYFLNTLSFTAKDISGEPQFSQTKTGDTLSKWMKLPSEQISVPARSKLEIPFSIQVPADALAESYQTAITVSGAPSEIVATNGAVVEAKTAILVFFTVSGDSQKKVALLDFLSSAKGFLSNLNQSFTFRLQNQGIVYAIPSGTIEIRDVFGRQVGQLEVNKEKSRVLPNTTRSFIAVLNDTPKNLMEQIGDQMKLFTMGPMTAKLHLDFGEGFEKIQATTSFWYIPYQLIGIALGLMAVLFLGYKKIQKHKTK
jgi:hypothetical protein